MDSSWTDELILLSLTGQIGEAEAEELRRWTASSEAACSYYEGIRDLWIAAGAMDIRDRYDARAAFARFREEYLSRNGISSAGRNRGPSLDKKILPVVVWRVAATLALLAVAGTVGWWWGSKTVKQAFTDIEMKVPAGSSARVTLPDGTTATLNASTRISYSQGFGVSDRHVRISGEGCFDVAPNDVLPFVIDSDNLRVRVLGTNFNFRDYPEDLEAVVALKRGRVTIANLLIPEGEKYLCPDQRVVLDKHNAQMRIESKDASNEMRWTAGDLFFDEELLSDIARELERCFDVRIIILGEELRRMRVYGHFSSQDMGVRDILESIAATHHLNYTQDGKEFIIQ